LNQSIRSAILNSQENTVKNIDPMEAMIETALIAAGIDYQHSHANPVGLDFYLPTLDLHIEVKQFHTNRIAEQMSRAPNVIVAQGAVAVAWLAKHITASCRNNPAD
jgi:hypothetical protein